jgi:hypothetical protein
MIDPLDAYLAGFFDGEGSISIIRRKPHGHVLHVDVGQIDRRPLELLRSRFGGSIQLQRRHSFGRRDLWYWKTGSQNAVPFLEAMLPYLIVKREQAELALRFQSRRLRGSARRDVEVVAAHRALDHAAAAELSASRTNVVV